MTSLKTIRKYLRNWIEDDSIDEIFTDYINLAIQECESLDFSELRSAVTVTPASGVITDPPRCRKIKDVTPYVASGYPAFRFEFRDRELTTNGGGSAMCTISPYEAYSVEDAAHSVSYTQGGTTLTQEGSTFFVADDIGKRVMLQGADEMYELISIAGTDPNQTAVVSPAISAETSSAGTALLNPAGTKRYILKTPANETYSEPVTITYQKKHPVVYDDNSLLLIPCPQSVALLALQQALMTNKYDVDAERLATAVMMAKNRELGDQSIKHTKVAVGDAMFSVRTRR